VRQRADNARLLQQRGEALAAELGFESRQDGLQRDLTPQARIGGQIDGGLRPLAQRRENFEPADRAAACYGGRFGTPGGGERRIRIIALQAAARCRKKGPKASAIGGFAQARMGATS
jgi:hypothetical protein